MKMAASTLCNVLGRLNKIFPLSSRLSAFQQDVRFASKKAGSTSKNKRKNTPGQSRGYKKTDGQFVEEGMILYRQLGLKVYPGENVGAGRDLTLFALVRGHLIVTTERLTPYPHSPLYPAVKAGRVVYKTFYNVIPEKQQPHFKLVSQT